MCDFCCTTLRVINPVDSYYSLHNGAHSSLKTRSKLTAGTRVWLRDDWGKKSIKALSVHSFLRENKLMLPIDSVFAL